MLKELKVRKAINGDEKAFIALIDTQKEKLYKTAYAYVKNEQDALDIVQETVYKAYVSIDTLKSPKYFNTWLTRILINISINTLNKNKKVVYLESEMLKEDTTTMRSSEEKLDMLDELNKLEEKYRDVIILKYFDDLTVSEVAKVLEIPIGTAKTYLNRGLSSLRISMGKERL
ncbi:sigma-70 family RNA polymerase sigma factor [Clostridium sp.]|uniref:sigma-70 family RNA polymerase sigma factor n=1 Tax=Clostridium sp. TaxID=1506 RepID=UPI003F38E4D3